MCGRYATTGPISRYQAHFDAELLQLDFKPRYNAAPTQMLPVVRQSIDGRRILTSAQWGLVPSWAKPDAKLPKPINAQAETAALKPMFRHAFRMSRVLVPADHFYEWKVVAGRKQPMLIRLRSSEPMGFAGLLEHSPDGSGTFTILTVPPNEMMREIHNRMPAIVWPRDYAHWLDPLLTDVEQIHTMLSPYPSEQMEAWPISTRVNSTRNEGAELMEPISAFC